MNFKIKKYKMFNKKRKISNKSQREKKINIMIIHLINFKKKKNKYKFKKLNRIFRKI